VLLEFPRSASLDTGGVPKSTPGTEPLIFEPLISSAILLRSSDTRPIVWCIIGFCAGIYLFFQGFRLLQRRHLILDTPVSKIRSASLGMVELSGLAVGPFTMIAPITQRSCFYYRTVAWEWKRSGRSSQWVKVAAECVYVPFFLDDNTGKVLVDPRGADLDLHRDFQEEFCDSFFTTKEEAPDNVRGFLARHGISTTNKIKVEEFCIKPKNALFLLGTLHENPGLELTPQPIQETEAISLTTRDGFSVFMGGSGLAQAALSFATGGASGFRATPIVITGNAEPPQVIHLPSEASPTKAADMTQQQKIATALLKAGISSPAAWVAAGVTTSPIVNSDPNGLPPATVPNGSAHVPLQTEPDGFDPHPPVVLMKGKNSPTFLISWRSQRDLARSLGWKCSLMIWGGPLLSLLCLYGLHLLTPWF
jgi:E3 Ubiquitin ligase